MRFPWAIRLLACVMLAAVWQADSAYAALSPTVTTAQIRDFTRITFNWPQKVRFKVDEAGPGVTLTFNQPADIDLNAIRNGLGPRLQNSSVSKDGASITLTFDQPYRIRHFISGNANGIDILGAGKNEADPPEPQQNASADNKKPAPAKPEAAIPSPAQPAATAKPVEQAPQEPKVANAEVVQKPAPLTPAVEKTTPAVVTAPTPEPVTADKQETAAPEKTPEVKTEPAPETEEAPPTAADVKAMPEQKQSEKTADQKTEETNPAIADLVDTENEKLEAPSPAADAEPEEKPSDAVEPEQTAEQPEDDEAPVDAAESEAPVEAAEPAGTQEAAPAPSDEAPAAKTNAEDAFAGLIEEGAATSSGTPAPVIPVTLPGADANQSFVITALAKSNGTEIRFPWLQRTAAAIFFRDSALWVVFDSKRTVDLKLLESILPASITSLNQIDHPTHTVLVLGTDSSLHARVTQPKGSVEWWVTLSPYRQIPAAPISPEVKADARIPNLYLPVLEYSPPITITDPVVGDELVVTPFFRPGEGFYPARDYAEMTVLETAQGLAVLRKSDDSRVVPLRNGLRLTARNGGLTLSTDMPQLALDELESLTAQYSTWFPYDQWKAEPGKFIDTRRDLEHKLSGASDIRANSIRLKLAQMYLAEGMGFETLGLLNMIRSIDPAFYDDRQLAALHGAANFLVDRYPEAIEDFNSPTLKDSKELQVWQQALSIMREDRSRFDYLDHYPGYINKYPPKLREKLAILAADNYINRRSYSKALKTFDTLSETGIDPKLMPYVDFLLGKISAENKQIETAKSIWKPLTEQQTDRFIRARAEFALTTLLYNEGEISAGEAINRLDRLRIVWRGDSLELNLLNYLGQLYIDNGHYLSGLRAWRELIAAYPDSPLAGPVAREMAKTFNHLFAEGGADNMEPLEALATFYEFRELTPVGGAGDKMIQGLADRLAGVDLLDRAAALLEHQLKYRQEGEARSSMGAQLALIYLLNKEPERALDVLELTGYGENPPTLRRKRTQLAAMALSETGEPDKALEMLEPDLSSDAEILRLNIYWKLREWNQVVVSAEKILGSRPDVAAPLNETESEYLLQLSIAYMFERNSIQLQYLRNYFAPLMPAGPNRDIFLFVTDASGPIDPNRFDQVSQQISRIENFMQTYRNRVSEGGLSSAVN